MTTLPPARDEKQRGNRAYLKAQPEAVGAVETVLGVLNKRE